MGSSEELRRSLGVIEALAEDIGPRPPGSAAEREAAERVASELHSLGCEDVELQRFPARRSFGTVYAGIFGMALAPIFVPHRRPWLRRALAAGAVVAGQWEGDFRSWAPLERLRRRRSQNVIARLDPDRGDAEETVCLVCHLDSSRSGLMFHPRLSAHLGSLLGLASIAIAAQALTEWLPGASGRSRIVRRGGLLARAIIASCLALVIERELRGVDVPGANDNASGVGACVALAGLVAARGLRRTRVVVLVTGGEEAGVLGMRSFLARNDTAGWLFVNFDGVGAAAPLRHLTREGGPLNARSADAELVALAERIGREGGPISMPLEHGSGLPYDATAVLARGGRAITITAQDGPIPNYHWPTDRFETIDQRTVGLAIELGWRMLSAIDETA